MPRDTKGSTITFSTCRPAAEPCNVNYRRLILQYCWQVFLRRQAISPRTVQRKARYGSSLKFFTGALIGNGPSIEGRRSLPVGRPSRGFFRTGGTRAIAKL